MILKPQDINIVLGERGFKFSTQEAYFLFAINLGNSPLEAAKSAGYSSPKHDVSLLLKNVEIELAIQVMAEMKKDMNDRYMNGEFGQKEAMDMYMDAYASAATSTEMKNVVDSMVKLKGLAAAERREIVLTNETQVRAATEQELIDQIGRMGNREIILSPEDYTVVKDV